ncbi:hypothetical protein MCHI_000976 [Candidatus Magnetoovum chiemensis]|nr:hypothetical protein MCHI_000976 [Candidatus Magnetoovum chiemensis]
MNINILRMSFALDTKLTVSDIEKIRGYIGRTFQDNINTHNHTQNGKVLYRYPNVQYKMIENICLIIGFDDGASAIEDMFHNIETINIKGVIHKIIKKELVRYDAEFSASNKQITYQFILPWLALNETNNDKYQRLGTLKQRKELLENVIIGNIISMSKSVGYTVPIPIKAEIYEFMEVNTKLKGNEMNGFLGIFSVNFNIPEFLGIGKSASRGFGTLIQIDE